MNLVLYGEVGVDFTAKDVADALKAGGAVSVNLNSIGGDVFDGLAIYNLLKRHKGEVEISIDGLAASAASLIACAGDKVRMAENALFMCHQASAGLIGYFEAAELDKVKNMLTALRDSIVTTYETRTGKPRAEIESMVDAETWLTAQEAMEFGFVDEISGAVEARIGNAGRSVFINGLELGCKKLDLEKLKAAVKPVAQEELKVEDKIDMEAMLKEAVQKERARIRNLNALKCDNSAVNAILSLAIEDGKEVEEIQPYVDAIKAAVPVSKPATPPVAEQLNAIIREQMSATEGVTGAAEEPSAKQAEMLAKFINQKLKGGAVR